MQSTYKHNPKEAIRMERLSLQNKFFGQGWFLKFSYASDLCLQSSDGRGRQLSLMWGHWKLLSEEIEVLLIGTSVCSYEGVAKKYIRSEHPPHPSHFLMMCFLPLRYVSTQTAPYCDVVQGLHKIWHGNIWTFSCKNDKLNKPIFLASFPAQGFIIVTSSKAIQLVYVEY